MVPLSQKKRKVQDGIRGKTDRPKKRIRKQLEYHSSSEDEDEAFTAVNLNDSDEEAEEPARTAPSKSESSAQVVPDGNASSDSDENTDGEEDNEQDQEEEDEDADDNGTAASAGTAKRKPMSKRNDPEAFSTSMSKILSTKLSQSNRKDPVLSRSREAAETSTALANERLDKKARAKMRAEKKEELDRGRIKDVLGLESGQAGVVAEEEKRLRKIAQRGVVKLFNAVRAAQVKAEQAAREERKKGTIGMANREEKVSEMSKQGFLDLIGSRKNVKTGA